MAATIYPSFTLILFGIAVIVAAAIIIGNQKRKITFKKRYRSTIGNVRYTSGEFNKQMELDMRLPYRRFKQLYPYSPWTYEEYKRMQKQAAFRRSTSSQENKRMVR